MKVILRENVEHLGAAGSVVNVKPGYARNYLIPRNFAVPATKNTLAAFEHERRLLDARQAKLRKEAESLKEKLEKTSCSISKKVGEQDKLFGSVTSHDIEQAFKAEGLNVDKKDILLEEPIKALGVYTVPIRIVDDVVANTKVWVVREEG
ncbi:MAG: 50S ribosomal protein L9 [Bdellovibrionales bacterium]|nr:50S ribosomal protein L9 [Bdellovibrionales bacterium]